ncbi:unnamed protein product, partial [marine sediment metagenome]
QMQWRPPSMADASVIGSAEPAISGLLVGDKGSILHKYFPDGLQINIGPTMVASVGIAGALTLFILLTYTAKKIAPEEYAVFLITLSEIREHVHPSDESQTAEEALYGPDSGPFAAFGKVMGLFQ